MDDLTHLNQKLRSLRVVFFGTPQFAVPTLEVLAHDPQIEIIGLVTQPDRPSGRGQKLMPPPVKQTAETLQLSPIFQPVKVRTDEAFLTQLDALGADFFVTIAFGQILPQRLLDMPKFGTVNVHASLLPELRGANPIQWSILNGHTETGLTTMLTDAGVDTGAMLLKTTVTIDPAENADTLATRLSQLGGPLLLETLVGLAQGTLTSTPQDHDRATHAPKLSKQDAWLDWSQPVEGLLRKIRGQQPWPATQSLFQGEPLKIFEAALAPSPLDATPVGEGFKPSLLENPHPGDLLAASKSDVVIACGPAGHDRLKLVTVQPPGKKPMAAADWFRGVSQTSDSEKLFLTSPELVSV